MQTHKLNRVSIRSLIFTFIHLWFSSSFSNVCFSELNQRLIKYFKGKIIVSSKWKRAFFKSLSCHKMNYSSVPHKRNKCPHLLFSKKYLSLALPPLLLLLEHPLHTHTNTHTNSRTHINYWFFIIFRKKIRKMRFKLSNEVRKRWLFFLYTLICIVLSQYACRLLMKLRHMNQIRQILPSFLPILF